MFLYVFFYGSILIACIHIYIYIYEMVYMYIRFYFSFIIIIELFLLFFVSNVEIFYVMSFYIFIFLTKEITNNKNFLCHTPCILNY